MTNHPDFAMGFLLQRIKVCFFKIVYSSKLFIEILFPAGVSAAALVIHKKDEIKPESPKTSPYQTRHSLTADMLAEIASSLKPVQREEIEKNEKQEPVGLPLSNGVTATSSSSSSSSSSSASSSPDEKRKFPLRSDPISQVHFNGVVNLETPNRIQWSGDGLTMNIIETSTFNN